MPDAPSARPLPGEAAARSFGRADRARTSRLPPTADALDWGLLAPLFGGGCLFLALGVLRDSGPAFLAAAILFGMAAAMGYDRQVGVLLRRVALPGLRHALLLLACCVTMLLLLTKLDLALKPLDSWHATPVQITIDLIGRSLSGLAAMLLALPLFAALVRKSPADGQERPLWPLYAALAGGGLCCYLLAGQWTAFTWPARYGTLDWLEIGMTAPVMPPASLLIGASLSVWWQSLTRADMPGLDRNRLFPAAIRSALIMTALPLPVFVIVSSGLFGPVRSIVQGSATLSLITCLAWLYALWRILPLQPTSGLRALGAAFALNLLLAAMFGIAGYKGWDPYLGDLLQLLVGFPVLLTGWWLVVKKVPRWVSQYV
jgi:hypothetical protein